MASKAEIKLREVLLHTGLVLPVKSSSKGAKISVLSKLISGQDKSWLRVVKKILELAFFNNWNIHLCRQYLLKDGEMVFGWHLSIEAKKTSELDVILNTLQEELADVGPGFSDPPEQPIQTPSLPNVERDPEVLKAKLQSHTTALPRPPSQSAPDKQPPPGWPAPEMQIVRNTIDKKTGKPIVEYEMPLPNVYTADMNKPNAKGRGAWTGDFHVGSSGNKT